MSVAANKRAFVLVLVLMVLAVAGVLTGLIATRCAQKGLAASLAQQDLQARWGAISCQSLLLTSPEDHLWSASQGAAPKSCVQTAVKLGKLQFRLTLADEQAKPNINMLSARDAEGLDQKLIQLQLGCRVNLPVRLKPMPYLNGQSAVPVLYGSFDQLFSYSGPSQLVPPREPEIAATQCITCWGSGQLNFRRCTQQAMENLLAGVLTQSQVQKLLKFVQSKPDCTLDQMISELKPSPKAAADMRALLIDTSRCHSLWIEIEGVTRNWYCLLVRQEGDEQNDSRFLEFRW